MNALHYLCGMALCLGTVLSNSRVILIRHAYWKGRESLIEYSAIQDENPVVVIKFLNCGIRFSRHVKTSIL